MGSTALLHYEIKYSDMRKRFLIVALWIIASAVGLAQSVLPADVVGTWKVVGGEINTPAAPDKAGAKMVQTFKEQFFHSVFVFKSDNNFSFNIGLEDMSIKNGHWKYNVAKQQYEIQEWANKDKNNSYLIILQVICEGDKTYIIIPTLDEIPAEFSFKLEVVRTLGGI